MFKWIKDFFTPASASFNKATVVVPPVTAPVANVSPQITDSVTQATAPVKPNVKRGSKKNRSNKSPANKKAK